MRTLALLLLLAAPLGAQVPAGAPVPVTTAPAPVQSMQAPTVPDGQPPAVVESPDGLPPTVMPARTPRIAKAKPVVAVTDLDANTNAGGGVPYVPVLLVLVVVIGALIVVRRRSAAPTVIVPTDEAINEQGGTGV